MVKNLLANAGDGKDSGLILGSGRSPGGGHGNPLQYSYLENPMDRGAWQAIVHRVTKSQTQLKRLSTYASTLDPYCDLLNLGHNHFDSNNSSTLLIVSGFILSFFQFILYLVAK